jgi:spore coat polysaccharide biosynthesis protein SpsF (cytidylyltransferase family)
MAEGYHANNKKTPQGVTNVEVMLFNHLMQARLKGQTEQRKEQTEQWKEQTEQWKGSYFTLNGKPKDLQLKVYCHELS